MEQFLELNQELAKLYKEITGRGPKSLKSYQLDNLLIIKMNWYEEKIFTSIKSYDEGRSIIQKTYKSIFKFWGDEAKNIIKSFIGCDVAEMFFDDQMALHNSDKIIVFLLKEI